MIIITLLASERTSRDRDYVCGQPEVIMKRQHISVPSWDPQPVCHRNCTNKSKDTTATYIIYGIPEARHAQYPYYLKTGGLKTVEKAYKWHHLLSKGRVEMFI